MNDLQMEHILAREIEFPAYCRVIRSKAQPETVQNPIDESPTAAIGRLVTQIRLAQQTLDNVPPLVPVGVD